MQGIGPGGIQRRSDKKVGKTKGKKASLDQDSEFKELEQEMGVLKEDLEESFS